MSARQPCPKWKAVKGGQIKLAAILYWVELDISSLCYFDFYFDTSIGVVLKTFSSRPPLKLRLSGKRRTFPKYQKSPPLAI